MKIASGRPKRGSPALPQIVFGSDYPYYTVGENVDQLARIDLTAAQRQAIDYRNAERPLPRLKA